VIIGANAGIIGGQTVSVSNVVQDAQAPELRTNVSPQCAEAMIELQDTSRACIALAEFGETYPALASGRLSDKYESNRQKVSC
jgi:hypothetical protein